MSARILRVFEPPRTKKLSNNKSRATGGNERIAHGRRSAARGSWESYNTNPGLGDRNDCHERPSVAPGLRSLVACRPGAALRGCEIMMREPRSGGERIAPGGAKRNPGLMRIQRTRPGRGGRTILFTAGSVAPPGLHSLFACQPGVPLRSTPGYCLLPPPGPGFGFFTAPLLARGYYLKALRA